MAELQIYTLLINDKNSLLSAYMPYVKNGGIFLKGVQHTAGQEVGLLLTIPGEHQVYTLTGKTVWITPKTQMSEGGIGVQFPENQESVLLKNKIDTLLGGTDRFKQATFTA